MFAQGTEDRASLQDYSSSQQIRGVCDHWEKRRSSSLTAFTDSECSTTPKKKHSKPPNTGRKEWSRADAATINMILYVLNMLRRNGSNERRVHSSHQLSPRHHRASGSPSQRRVSRRRNPSHKRALTVK